MIPPDFPPLSSLSSLALSTSFLRSTVFPKALAWPVFSHCTPPQQSPPLLGLQLPFRGHCPSIPTSSSVSALCHSRIILLLPSGHFYQRDAQALRRKTSSSTSPSFYLMKEFLLCCSLHVPSHWSWACGRLPESYLLLTPHLNHHQIPQILALGSLNQAASHHHHLPLGQADVTAPRATPQPSSCPLPDSLSTSIHIRSSHGCPPSSGGRTTIPAHGSSRGCPWLAFPALSVVFFSALLSGTICRPGLCPSLKSQLSPFLWGISSDPLWCSTTTEIQQT